MTALCTCLQNRGNHIRDPGCPLHSEGDTDRKRRKLLDSFYAMVLDMRKLLFNEGFARSGSLLDALMVTLEADGVTPPERAEEDSGYRGSDPVDPGQEGDLRIEHDPNGILNIRGGGFSTLPDAAMHPTGKCSCAGAGECWWCLWTEEREKRLLAETRLAGAERRLEEAKRLGMIEGYEIAREDVDDATAQAVELQKKIRGLTATILTLKHQLIEAGIPHVARGSDRDRIFREVWAERDRQEQLYPGGTAKDADPGWGELRDNVSLLLPRGEVYDPLLEKNAKEICERLGTGSAIAFEEFCEVACAETEPERRVELIQLIACLVAIVEGMDA